MKKFIIGLLLAFIVLLFPKSAIAAGEFTTNTSIYYQINNDGTTEVTHYITLINNFTDFYATNYSLELFNISAQTVTAFNGQTVIPHEVSKSTDERSIIKINFPDVVVGQGSKREFSIRYIDKSVARKTGEVWEISAPRLANPDTFNSYSVTVSVPSLFGEMAYVSPEPYERKLENARHILRFDKAKMVQSAVVAAFGKFQVFSFELNYHLENPVNRRSSVELAVPPDTAYQQVLLQEMTPKPLTINKDSDGNWLAYYILNPRERLDVKVKGSVQIFPEKRNFPRSSIEVLEENKKESEVWQINDPDISKLATQLKTPEAIYNYVSQTLNYNLERAVPNVVRLGALEAFKNPNNAICMEFTDLFIALARAAGIPAREVNGFAYTENPESEPLSLVADVLHAWPEYWDETKGVWVPVDPTWGSTTGGEDFFHKLDLRHFAFVHHGKDPFTPYAPGSYKLGPNPDKDIFVHFGQLPLERSAKPKLELIEARSPIFKDMAILAKVENQGVVSLEKATVNIYFDDKLYVSQEISNLPPFAFAEVPVNVPFNLLGSKMPEKVSMEMGDQVLNVSTHKASIIMLNISIIFLLIFLLLLFSIVRIRKIRFYKLGYALTGFKNKFTNRVFPKRNA